jgi:NAD(P)-dependent dehydrogenase (short-subunit alcohol dehydrogenase family)
VTGGGTGMGRELARQLVAKGCAVAICDVSDRGMAETQQPVLDRADRLPDTYSRPFQLDSGAPLAPF